MICGVRMPDGLKENDKFPTPIITPATKSTEGHDEDISIEEIISRKITSKKNIEAMADYALKLYERGSEIAAGKGLILVDTKYEFGLFNKKIYLIDEVHTPDSSRFFYLDTYEKLQKEGKPQKQLSKEFVREWLMANGFQGLQGEVVPDMTDEFVDSVTARYTELYEAMTLKKLDARSYENVDAVIEENIQNELAKLP